MLRQRHVPSLASAVTAVAVSDVVVLLLLIIDVPNNPNPRTLLALLLANLGFAILGVPARRDANVTSARVFQGFHGFLFLVSFASKDLLCIVWCGVGFAVARSRYLEILRR